MVFEIFTLFHFLLKSKMAVQIKILPFCIGHSCTTMCVKNLPEIAVSLTIVRDIHTFPFSAKIQDGRQNGQN